MANKKEIQVQINSVKNTQAITQAMNMVAAAKMRKTQSRMIESRPYAQAIHKVIGHIALANLACQHPYLEKRSAQRIGYLIVSTDRGLCGGLNVLLFKQALIDIQKWQDQGSTVALALIGAKAMTFFNALPHLPILAHISNMGDKPTLAALIGIVTTLLTTYQQQKLDRLYLIYNKFITAMTQSVQIDQLLPLPKSEQTERKVKMRNWDYLYEPNPKQLLDTLLTRFIESQVYQAVVENLACEQAARMVAMQAATENAKELLNELQLTYNKTRQAYITQELNEIVASTTVI